MYYLIALVLLAAILAPLFVTYYNMKRGKKTTHSKRAILFNLAAFAVVCLTAIILPLGGFASAATSDATGLATGLGYLGAGLSTGLACIGAGVGVGHGAAAAIGAVTEDPKVFGRAMIFVV
ncbi:MAG: ATPase, partial [Ethanoligenens sp.]